MPEKIVVVGAGQMGTGIAHAFAVGGMQVILMDSAAGAIAKAMSTISAIVADGIKLGKLSEDEGRAALSRFATQTDFDRNMEDAVLLIETATEKLEVKQAILRRADQLLAPGAVIATNTSALSISEIAAATQRAPQVVGMHFFNPVHKMKLVEIIRGVETNSETIQGARGWARAIGKTSILVNESPGFTTSRISALLGNEAMYMLSEGVASAEDIDTSHRLAFNHPMGPLELGDLTGWDTRLQVLHYLHETLGEKYRPCPLIVKMVKSGRHGRKVGKGVYEYGSDGQRIPGSGLKVQV
jgi:3-hydroxybutyryl-CoA dehydrogenase